MLRVRTFNNIAKRGLEVFNEHDFLVGPQVENPQAILLRSHPLATDDLESSIFTVARAGAGVNNVPVKECTEHGIVVFNTPGANANSVKELVIAALLLSARDVVGSISFVNALSPRLDKTELKTQVEEGKRQFSGRELNGRVLGVVGLGAVGASVARAALSLGMEVLGHDPYLSVDAAWRIPSQVRRVDELTDLFQQSDFATLHVPANDQNRGLISHDLLKQAEHGLVLLNFARSEIVDSDAVLDALHSGRLDRYFVDFPETSLLGHPSVYATPHLGASTEEAEENCAVMAARQIVSFLVDGTIENSVNFPSVSLERTEGYRLAVSNWNVAGMLGNLLSIMATKGINVIDMINKSRGDVAYNLIDIDIAPPAELLDEMRNVSTVIGVRSLEMPKERTF